MNDKASRLQQSLLDWYDRHGRTLPWRINRRRGETANPYFVWLSEIMLQQTTVATVIPYFRRFVRRWPTVDALAAAPLDDILHAWQGLGYYARARNLHKCARRIITEHGGQWPTEEAALLALPGIGRYTAAAIQAIAFDKPANVVDGNVERVMARLHGIATPLPAAKPDLAGAAARLAPRRRPGDHAQALMDLGATVCTPRNPQCPDCPWEVFCAARKTGLQETLPRRGVKKTKPGRYGVIFWTIRNDTGSAGGHAPQILMRRRPESGLLGGLSELPGSPWEETVAADRHAALSELAASWRELVAGHAPVVAEWHLLDGFIRHTFTHFHLVLAVVIGHARGEAESGYWWPVDDLDRQALPTVMKKVVSHALRQRPAPSSSESVLLT